jgi:hypothetical protein
LDVAASHESPTYIRQRHLLHVQSR